MSDLTASEATRTGAWSRLVNAVLPGPANPRDREFLRDLALLGGALFALTVVAYLATTTWALPFPRDKIGLVLGRDFLNLWMYGRAIFDADPARFYDVVTYNAELLKMLGPGYPWQNWPNPPTALLVMAPFGLLNYFPALAVWLIAGLIALALTGRRLLRDARVLTLVLVSPAALLCLISGQSSFLTTTALIGACLTWDKRPMLAGVLIGLLTLKPQLGVLLPFALVAAGRWKVFTAAAATALTLLALSYLCFGPDVWVAYVTKALPLQREVLADPSGIAMPFHATIFMNLRGWLGNDLAMTMQTAATLGAIIAVVWAFRVHRDANPWMLFALLLACTQSASPYMSTYDLLPLTLVALVLLADGKLDQTGRRLAQLVFWTPALQLLFGSVQAPGPGLIAPIFAIYLAAQFRQRADGVASSTLAS